MSNFYAELPNIFLHNSDSRFQTLAPKCQSITLNQNSDSRFHSLMLNRPNYIAPRTAIPDSKLLHWTAKLCCCANSDSWMLETLILDSKLLTVILGKVHSLFFTLTYGISLLLEMSQLYLNHGNLSCWIERIDRVDRKNLYLRMFMSPRNP